jgi:hypothetical protein
MYDVLFKAVKAAIEDIGLENFRKTSFFMSNWNG